MAKWVLMVANVPSMIGQFNMNNIHILLDMDYKVDVAADFTDTSVWPVERVQKFKDQMREMGIKCIQIDFSRSPLKLGRHIGSYKEMKKLIKNRQYSFIHTHTPIASAIVRLAAKKTNTKVIYTAHGFHFYDGAPIKNWLLYYPIEKWLSRYTDVLITINKEDYKWATEKFKAKKTVYIPGVGVDTEKFAVCKVDTKEKRLELGVKENDFLLMTVGELSERKNQKVIIDALGKMKTEGIIGNIVYLAVGKGDMQETFENLIDQYGLGDHVKLLGYRSDIDELCETVDCFVHPSVREGLGIAPLEAMAAGLPLISANVNGIKDYTGDGVSGCCIDPTDVHAMVKAIKKMRDDEAFRSKCAANNYKTAKTFDIQNTNEIMTKIFRGGGGYKHLLTIAVRQEKRAEIGIPVDAILLISVGELSARKNHEVVVQALQELPENYWYVIVGKGNLKDELETMDYTGRLKILGYRTDIVELLHSSDLFVFPSLQEGLPVALMEAMASEVPCVCSRIRGNTDLIDDKRRLFDPSKKGEIKTRICRSYEDKDKRKTIGTKKCKCINKFDSKVVNYEMKKVYKTV